MKTIVYVVTMYRFGSKENHSYVYGVYNKKAKALKEADFEEEMRGGKYKAEVIECTMNESFDTVEFKKTKSL